MFTRALALAEHEGKSIHLSVAAATEIWEGILRSAQSLQSSTIVLGSSAMMPVAEEARYAGLAWEKLPDPKPHLALEIHTPDGLEEIFYLGPHAPHLTPKEIDLLHKLWLRFSTELAPEEVHHHDIVHFALNEVSDEIAEGKEAGSCRAIEGSHRGNQVAPHHPTLKSTSHGRCRQAVSRPHFWKYLGNFGVSTSPHGGGLFLVDNHRGVESIHRVTVGAGAKISLRIKKRNQARMLQGKFVMQ